MINIDTKRRKGEIRKDGESIDTLMIYLPLFKLFFFYFFVSVFFFFFCFKYFMKLTAVEVPGVFTKKLIS